MVSSGRRDVVVVVVEWRCVGCHIHAVATNLLSGLAALAEEALCLPETRCCVEVLRVLEGRIYVRTSAALRAASAGEREESGVLPRVRPACGAEEILALPEGGAAVVGWAPRVRPSPEKFWEDLLGVPQQLPIVVVGMGGEVVGGEGEEREVEWSVE